MNPQGLELSEGARAALLVFLPLFALQAVGLPVVGVAVGFGALFVLFGDAGADYPTRLRSSVITAVGGALLISLGLAIGGPTWVSALAMFVVALLGTLVSVYGQVPATVGRVLTIAIDLGLGPSLFHLTSLPWGVYYLAGGLLTVLSVLILAWLAPSSPSEPPSGGAPSSLVPLGQQFTPRSPLLRFTLLRAAAIAAAASVSWGVGLPRPYWSPIPAIVALRPQRGTLVVIVQYLLGSAVATGLAAGVGAAFLDRVVREIAAFTLTFLAFSVRGVNYGLFIAGLIAVVLLIVTMLGTAPIPLPELRIIETVLGAGIAALAVLAWGNRGADPL